MKFIDEISIEGPTTFDEYIIPVLSKHIYLFGDNHSNNKICKNSDIKPIPFEQFLENIFIKNPDKIMDFYIEHPFISKKIYTYEFVGANSDNDWYITRIQKYFKLCLTVDKSKCKYKNVRFHYVDIRNINELITKIHLLYIDISNFNANSDKQEWINKLLPLIKKDIITVYNMLSNIDIEELFRETKIQKQFYNITNKNYKDWFIKYYTLQFDMVKKNLLKNMKTMMSYDGIKNKFLTTWLLELPGVLMDAYTIGRIFRSFEDGSPKNIIIYVGEWHIDNIKNMLNQIKAIHINNSTSNKIGEDFQCLTIKGLFSYLNLSEYEN